MPPRAGSSRTDQIFRPSQTVEQMLQGISASRDQPTDAEILRSVILAILDGYARGTRCGIRMDNHSRAARGGAGLDVDPRKIPVGA